jgi:hypothetical protein
LYQNKSSTSPSSHLGITNTWLAYQFDETVQLFGQRVEMQLHEEKNDAQREILLRELLDIKAPPKKVQMSVLASLPGVSVRRKKKKKPEAE